MEMIVKSQIQKMALKRILLLASAYTAMEIIGLILSSLGFFESDIRLYVFIVVVFNLLIIGIIIWNMKRSTPMLFMQYLPTLYTAVMIIWGIILTALVYLQNQDITIVVMVLMTTSALFMLKPVIYAVVLGLTFIIYGLAVQLTLENQHLINELWFKGFLFFILAYLINLVNFRNKYAMISLSMSLKEKNRELKDKAIRDSLSGLYNNAYIFEYLNQKLDIQYRGALSVLMMDIDNFKRINDTYGHLFGDHVIKRISDELKDSIGVNDVLGRYGGEEFIVILNQSNINRTIEIAERIRTHIEELSFEYPIKVTISVGIAFYNGESADELIKKADDQLYRAKSLGKNRVQTEEEEI